jgi:hypothetical protein
MLPDELRNNKSASSVFKERIQTRLYDRYSNLKSNNDTDYASLARIRKMVYLGNEQNQTAHGAAFHGTEGEMMIANAANMTNSSFNRIGGISTGMGERSQTFEPRTNDYKMISRFAI